MAEKAVPIAIVGLNALFPGATNKQQFWQNILEGRDLISDVPESHFSIEAYYDANPGEQDKVYCTRGGFLPDIAFDPMEFGIPPSSLEATDSSQLLALQVAKQVLEEASQGQFSHMDRDKMSVILGVTSASELVVDLSARIQRPVWAKALREQGLPEDQVQIICDRIAAHYVPWQEGSFPGLLGNVVAGRIANRLDLGGSNLVTDAACASSLSAVSMAMMELATYQSDLVITGGVDTMNNIFMYMCFTKTPALSRTGDCRPFSHDADGTILGEGIGMVALKRLADAERDQDRIYAVIQGYGASSDGKAKSVYAPNPLGQAKALRRAYTMAGYGPDTVELVEAHGTGTKAGDLAEFTALREVFNESGREDRNWCALGSIKSQIGHTKAAAGAASLFKVVMALHHKILPPTIKVTEPNPKLNIEESPFYINTEVRPWFSNPHYPRRASLSSFGFGGSNFHVTLEEYTGPAQQAHHIRSTTNELFVFSAEDANALIVKCDEWYEQLAQAGPEQHLQNDARVTQALDHENLRARLALVASSRDDALQKLHLAKEYLENGKTQFTAPGLYGYIPEDADDAKTPKIAYLFPGQGSQYIGMMKHIVMAFPELRHIWEEVVNYEALQDLPQLVYPRPVFQEAAKTEQVKLLSSIKWAQPAIGAASLTGLKFLQRLGIQPDALGGHSYGEVVALHAAGVIDQHTMLDISRARAVCMKEAAEKEGELGAMTAVFQSAESLQQWIEQQGLSVVIANNNGPEQCVLSGSVSELENAELNLKEQGIRYQRLPVAGAFHSPLVAEATKSFQSYLKNITFTAPQLPVYSNDEGKRFANDATSIKKQLARQIAKPVHFVRQIERMIEQGVTIFIEVGPSSVLSGLVMQIAQHLKLDGIQAFSLDKKGVNGMEQASHLLAQLFVNAVPMNMANLWENIAPTNESYIDHPNRMSVKIRGSNYGKPYPSDQKTKSPAPTILEPQLTPLNPTISEATHHVASHEVMNEQSIAIHDQGGLELNKQIQEAHALYLKMISDNHSLFLQAAAHAPQQETHGATSPPSWATSSLAANQMNASAMEVAATMRPAPTMPPVQMPAAPSVAAQPEYTPVAPEGQGGSMPAASPTAVVPNIEPTTASPQQSVREILLGIASDKTGYPTDMLDLEADLESGLGIDSIKRVEIFAAAQDSIPGLPTLDPEQVTGLHTLLEIETFIEQLLGKKKVS